MGIDISSSFIGRSISQAREFFASQNLSIIDTNNNGVFDAADKCSYTVQPGDSLWNLQKKFNGCKVKDFLENNPFIKDADRIKPGEVLTIPFCIKNEDNVSDTSQAQSPQVQQPQQPSVVTPPLTQVQPPIADEPKVQQSSTNENPFGNVKTKKIKDENIIKSCIGKSAEDLKKEGYYFVDTNGNNTFDEGEELHKQIVIMLDAGHGSGIHLQPNQTIILPNNGKYKTVLNDTLASIAKANNTTEEELKRLNPNAVYSRDPGAEPPSEYGNLDEADITGLACSKLHEILESQGFRVVDNIRTDGVQAHRAERRINKLRIAPDMFVSLHMNASPDKNDNTPHGEEIWYNVGNAEDKKFASAVNSELDADQTISKNRGLKNANNNLGVLNGDTKGQIAEILVEMAFISNLDDYNKMTDADTRKKQLEAIARGILNYYNTEIK